MKTITRPAHAVSGLCKILGVAALMASVGTSLSCGTSPARDPHGLILEEARVVSVYDVGAYLEARELPGVLLQGEDDTRSIQDEFLDYWEKSKAKNVFDVNLDEVTTVTTVYVDNNGTYEGYKVYRGQIDIVDVRAQMESGEFREEAYRDFPVWQHRSEPTTILLEEEDGAYVVGQEELVRDVVKAMARGEGFLDDRTAMGSALQAAGTGLWTVAFTDCQASHYHVPYVSLKDFEDGLPLLTSYPSLLRGCLANATTVTGGDEDLSKATMAIVFSSERQAERGLEDMRGHLEDFNRLDIDIDDTQIRGDLAVMELAIYE